MPILNRFLLSVCAGFFLCTAAPASERTALDEYIDQPDTNFSWRVVNRIESDPATITVLEMVSQQWLTTNEVNRPIWKHWLTVIVPNEVRGKTGLLFIGGGANDKPFPEKVDSNLMKVAGATKSVVAELRMVPNQPLTFKGETKGRFEDSLIAYTWDKYLRTGDERWPARLPMTKSAVRAMDAITQFCATEKGGNLPIEKYVVAGASKRGWTTWSTAAVDKRVVAIVPIVIDLLNVVPSFQHHYSAYGFWAPAVHDYVEMGIMNWMNTPEFKALLKIEEPFDYRDRLTMPKFLINSAGDQFFLPDSTQFYYDQLLGEKHLRYIPNSDHSLKNTDAIESLVAFYDAFLHGKKIPTFSWSFPTPGTIRVESKTKPAVVKLWQANNPETRDFRLDTIGPAYVSTKIEPDQDGGYLATLEKPAAGWTAYFLELTFENEPVPFKFTTPVQVIPDTLPHKGKFQPAETPRGFLSGASQ